MVAKTISTGDITQGQYIDGGEKEAKDRILCRLPSCRKPAGENKPSTVIGSYS